MGLYKAEAVILKGRDYKEADRILTIYSREEGKLNVIAKGVKKVKSRMRGSVQPFSYSGFILYSGRGTLDTVTQADLIEPFTMLRDDLQKWGYANYIMETLDGLVPERVVQEELFIHLVACLHLLCVHDPSSVSNLWHTRMLHLLGYAPHLDDCVNCGSPWTDEKSYFSSEQGGTVCSTCAGGAVNLTIHRGTVAVWNYLNKVSLDKIGRLKIGPQERLELNKIIRAYLEHILEKPLKSAMFLID